MTDEKRYRDVDGNKVTLDELVRRDPAWAANRIRVLEDLPEEVDGLRRDMLALERRNDRYLQAIRWALGEEGEFVPPARTGMTLATGKYWWRAELRDKARLVYDPDAGVSVDPDDPDAGVQHLEIQKFLRRGGD